jgi:hypothetical protein
MIVDLIQLLSERKIVHPSRIVSSRMADGEFRLSIAGYPWWRSPVGDDEGEISFRFSGVTSGQLDLTALLDQKEVEALEEFEIGLTSALYWAQADQFSIYCSAPLPHPIAVYTVVENYLLAAGAPRTPSDYLNGAVRLSQFLEIVSSNGYLLATGPQSICSLVVEELGAQSVPHTIVEAKGRSEGRLFIKLGDSAFFCETAVAEFE